jgi:hypothetical protein
MYCSECGADLPGEETCLDRFHALLGAEKPGNEAAQMHGLTVLTFMVQHPVSGGTPAWYPAAGRMMLHEMFGKGRGPFAVFAEMRQRTQDNDWRAHVTAAFGAGSPGPVPDETTVAAIDPAVPPGHAARVVAWAWSVAKARGLIDAAD